MKLSSVPSVVVVATLLLGPASCTSRLVPDDGGADADGAAADDRDDDGSFPGNPTTGDEGGDADDGWPGPDLWLPGGEGPGCSVPDGDTCQSDAACCSGHCWQGAPILPDLCGECSGDADCPGGGCTPPNQLPGAERGAFCNTGALGDGCETSAACQAGLHCREVFAVESFELVLTSCGECRDDADCKTGTHCSPVSDLGDFSGAWRCVAPGLPNGTSCDRQTSGDQVCAPGHCVEVDVEGLLTLEVCGDCEVDTDCDSGLVCQPGSLDIATFAVTGSRCVAP